MINPRACGFFCLCRFSKYLSMYNIPAGLDENCCIPKNQLFIKEWLFLVIISVIKVNDVLNKFSLALRAHMKRIDWLISLILQLLKNTRKKWFELNTAKSSATTENFLFFDGTCDPFCFLFNDKMRFLWGFWDY